MSARAPFRKADLKRAASGVLAAGLAIARIEIDNSGKIIIIPYSPASQQGNIDEWADLEP